MTLVPPPRAESHKIYQHTTPESNAVPARADLTAVCISVGTTRLKIFFAESGTATAPDLRSTIAPWFLK